MNNFVQNYFSPKRFWYLLRRDVLQILRPLGITFGTLGIIILIIGFLSSAMGGTGNMHYVFFYIFLFSVGAVFASLAFVPMHKKERNMSFLMTPASTLEKYLVKWLLVTVGFILAMIIFSTLVSLVTEGLSMLAFDRHHELFNPFAKVDDDAVTIWKVIPHFLIIQSLFFLGGAYFRRIQFITTFLILGGIGFICIILVTVFLGVVVVEPLMQNVMMYSGMTQMQGDMSLIEQTIGPYFDVIKWILRIFYLGLLAPLCYVIAFLRLKEAQVNYGV